MASWITRLFRRPPRPALPAPPPAWADEILEALQKGARAQARLALRVEELERVLGGGLAAVRAAVAAGAPPAVAAAPRPAELLDAMDLLDEAIRVSAAAGTPAVAAGLSGVLARLGRFLAELGLRRIASAAEPLDGKLFRVIGEEAAGPGAAVRVVRAAVCAGPRVVREGEVILARRSE